MKKYIQTILMAIRSDLMSKQVIAGNGKKLRGGVKYPLLLVLVCVLAIGSILLLSEEAYAYDGYQVVNGTVWYYNNVAGGVEITHAGTVYNFVCANYSGDVVIPKVLDGKTVVAIGQFAFRQCSNLKSVEIPDSVVSLGLDAFKDCTSLTSVIIPNSVVSIGTSAFINCTSLTSVIIPNSVVSIGHSAFGNCTSLPVIYIPDSVTSIGPAAFYNCSSLMYVRLPNPPPTMRPDAFAGTPYEVSVLSASYNVNEAVIKATEAAENTLNIISRLDNTTYGLSALNTQISELKNNSVSKDDITNLQNAINNIQSSMAPTITKVNGVNNSTATKTGTITIEISSSNATEYRARDKAGIWSEWTTSNTIPVPLLSKGVRTIEVQARSGGEGSAVANYTMTVFSL